MMWSSELRWAGLLYPRWVRGCAFVITGVRMLVCLALVRWVGSLYMISCIGKDRLRVIIM